MANQKIPTAAQQLRPDTLDEDDDTDFRVEREPDADRDQRGPRLSAEGERTLSNEDRLEMYRMQFMQARLPDLPPIPGYHVCWLSTTNQSDSVAWRTRLGYVPVTAEDMPGYLHMMSKVGEFAGMVVVNEMIAYKLPDDLYQLYMTEAHHNAPMGEDEKITAGLDKLQDEAGQLGGKLIEGDGMKALREQTAMRAPRFA